MRDIAATQIAGSAARKARMSVMISRAASGRICVRPVAQRRGRVVMHFHEKAVRSRGSGGARERARELRRAAGLLPFAAGLLHRMRDVVDHRRAESADDREGAHVDDEVLIAERRAALRDEDALVPDFASLVQNVLRLLGRKELALLHADRFSGARRGGDEIGLPAEKCRNLQDVEHFGGAFGLLPFVNVGKQRQARLVLHSAQDVEPFLEARPAERLDRRPIRLVKRRLEYEVDLQLIAQRQERPRHAQRVLARLDDARAGDEKGRVVAAERDGVGDGDGTRGHAPALYSRGGTITPWLVICTTS